MLFDEYAEMTCLNFPVTRSNMPFNIRLSRATEVKKKKKKKSLQSTTPNGKHVNGKSMVCVLDSRPIFM